ncbi:MAG TPA: SGNH/GDSL hydrolase family protein [Verrucomicrobiae bacterium]|nr:SGNH/GDSL hydrolase family protein [Verrucomicrobiae bacterium]
MKIILLQILLISIAALMGCLAQSSLPGVIGTVLLGGCLVAVIAARTERSRHRAILVSWLATPIALAILPVTPRQIHLLDPYHSFIAWLIAGAVLPTLTRVSANPARNGTKALVMIWAICGDLVCIVASYLQNHPVPFFAGLLLLLGTLIVLKWWFQVPPLGIQGINFCIVLLIGLPLVDLLVRRESQVDAQVALDRHYYSYKVAKQEPAAFATWWKRYLEQWDQSMGQIIMADPEGVLPFRLKPNTESFLFDSRVTINSLGFRGAEFSPDKANAYRIVVLGESTTFGCTLQAEDRPWPDVLAELIRERLAISRPVQVINAGVPAYNLKHNIGRLQKEILPLKPDMIISYHGANGFRLLDEALPAAISPLPSPYRQRPLKLLANCEYRWKMIQYRRRMNPQRLLDPGAFSNPLNTKYADAYRELIAITSTNNIRLVLANYAMAVNSQSDADVVQFYRIASPPVHWQIRANVVHTELLRQLTEAHPDVRMVNIHPNLDGDPDNFIDLAHMTQMGRQRMAENMFAGIRDLLERELSPAQKE